MKRWQTNNIKVIIVSSLTLIIQSLLIYLSTSLYISVCVIEPYTCAHRQLRNVSSHFSNKLTLTTLTHTYTDAAVAVIRMTKCCEGVLCNSGVLEWLSVNVFANLASGNAHARPSFYSF